MKTLLTLIVVAVVTVSAKGQISGDPLHTMDIIEASVRELADTMIARCDVSASAPLPLRIRQHPDAPWIRSVILRRFEERGIAISSTDDPDGPALDVVIEDASTRYHPMASRDSVERNVVVKLSSTCRSRTIILPPVTHRVTMARQSVDAYQSRQHQATHGNVPNADASMWDDVLEPLIYVGAAAVTLVLFFTVRTQ